MLIINYKKCLVLISVELAEQYRSFLFLAWRVSNLKSRSLMSLFVCVISILYGVVA